MKKRRFLIVTILSLMVLGFTVNSCKVDNDPKEYLQKVLNNLEKVNSASYFSTTESYAPGDTIPVFTSKDYCKEVLNPADTLVGAKFFYLTLEDTTKLNNCYDGEIRAYINHDEKRIIIDSFKNNSLPFRPINAPFFTKVKLLIKYVLETKDSLTITSKDYKDSVQFTFSILDKIVEIIGNRIIYSPSLFKGDGSRYDIWINKSNNLPYRYKREMPHDMNIETCNDVRINASNIKDFMTSSYFPHDFTIQSIKNTNVLTEASSLEGKVAPHWSLLDANNNLISLKEIKKKILMLQFTGVNCGACLASIPFLNNLALKYRDKDFDFVAIESFAKNTNVLKRYQERNKINYKLLMSNKEVTSSYQIQAVPVFLILDENRVIRKIIKGYGKSTTDKEIEEAINKLL